MRAFYFTAGWPFFRRFWRLGAFVVLLGFAAKVMVSCGAAAIPVGPIPTPNPMSPTPSRTPSPTPTLSATMTNTFPPGTHTPTPVPTSSPTATATSAATTGPTPDTLLSAGQAAVVGFTVHGTQNDQFAFVILKAVGAQTQIDISDENWDGAEFGTSDGAMITWVADRAYPAGTLVQVLPTSDGGSSTTSSYAVNIYGGGVTYTNVTGPGAQTGTYAFDPNSPIQVTTVANTGGGLTGWSAGDQAFLFQGPANLAETAAGVTFLGGLTYNTPWLTGTPTPTMATGAGTYLPPGLTDGVNALALNVPAGVGNGGVYNCALATGTAAGLSAAINNQANWSIAPVWTDLPQPALSSLLSVQ